MIGEADEALVVRSRRGDRAAFEELVRRTARLIFAHLYVKTCDVHKAEDLVQETYLCAWRSIADVDNAATFRAWLTTIANRVLVDSARRDSRKKRGSDTRRGNAADLSDAPDPNPSPAEQAALGDERARALKLLDSLPPDYRLPLLLRYIGGADYDEIGKQLAISNGSLRGLLQRGLKLLRERMKE